MKKIKLFFISFLLVLFSCEEETATPVVEEETSTEETATPVVEEETSTEETATPVVEEETSTEETATPVVEEETSTEETATPVVEEETSTEETVPPVVEEETSTEEPLTITLAGGATMPDDKIILVQGYTVKLKSNASDVSWSSSDSNVFSVTAAGVVKAEASSGTAIITATDGNRTAIVNVEIQALSGSGYDGGAGFTDFAPEIWNTVRVLTTVGGETNIDYGDLSQDDPATVPGYVLTDGNKDKLVVSKSNNSSFNINTTTYEAGDAVAVWIDWNIDGYFYGNTWDSPTGGGKDDFFPESNEYYLITEGVDSTGDASITIDIPNIARVGTLRMRVQCVWGPNTSAGFYANSPTRVGSTEYPSDSSVRDFEVEITE